MLRFSKFLLSQDRLGHPYSLNYRGSETHQTWLGTGLTLVVNVLVLIILTQKIDEVINMQDPEVQVYTRPILKEELEEAGGVNFAKNMLNVGFFIIDKINNDDGEIELRFRPLPEDESTITKSRVMPPATNIKPEYHPFVSCKNLFQDVDEVTEIKDWQLKVGVALTQSLQL